MSPSLNIYIVTFNRRADLQRTLEQLFNAKSPVRDCPITILDNHSTDGTKELIVKYRDMYKNIRVVAHAINIGGNANICRAMELAAGSEGYYWILGDDDIYDFSKWHEVDQAMQRGEKVICLSRYILPDKYKEDVAHQLVQTTFITGVIVHGGLVTDSVLPEAYSSIHTLFPQMVPIFSHVNAGGTIFVTSRPVVDNGNRGESGAKDVSYTRGCDINDVSPYSRYMCWISGWAAALASIRDGGLREQALMAGAKCVLLRKDVDEKHVHRSIVEWLSRYQCPELHPIISYVYAIAGKTLRRRLRRVLLNDIWKYKRLFYRACLKCLPIRREYYLARLQKYSVDKICEKS